MVLASTLRSSAGATAVRVLGTVANVLQVPLVRVWNLTWVENGAL